MQQYRNRRQYRFRTPGRPSQDNHLKALETPPMHHQSTETMEYSTSRTRRNQPNLRTKHCHQYTSRPPPKTTTVNLWKTITKWIPKSPIYRRFIPLSTHLLPLRILLTDPALLSHQNSSKYLATHQSNRSLRKPIIHVPLPTSILNSYRTLPTTTTDILPTHFYRLPNTYRPTAHPPKIQIQKQPNIFLRRPFHRKIIYSLTSPIPISKPSITFQSTSCNIYIHRALPTTSYQIFNIYRPTTRLPNKYLPYPILTDIYYTHPERQTNFPANPMPSHPLRRIIPS